MEGSLFAGAVTLGLLGLAIYAFLEKILPVLPSFPFLIFVGMVGGEQSGGVGFSLAAVTIGSTLGALALFILGRRIDNGRMRAFGSRYGRYIFLSVERYDRVLASYRRRQFMVTLIGQLVPGTRNIMPVSAGTVGIRVMPFLIATLLSGLAWNATFLTLGYAMSG
jgi:alkaline phosphatase